tara:strand:+ start:1415 stop:1567 length:153 start_codon:yes stop_codon:yes gene_type:complete
LTVKNDKIFIIVVGIGSKLINMAGFCLYQAIIKVSSVEATEFLDEMSIYE